MSKFMVSVRTVLWGLLVALCALGASVANSPL